MGVTLDGEGVLGLLLRDPRVNISAARGAVLIWDMMAACSDGSEDPSPERFARHIIARLIGAIAFANRLSRTDLLAADITGVIGDYQRFQLEYDQVHRRLHRHISGQTCSFDWRGGSLCDPAGRCGSVASGRARAGPGRIGIHPSRILRRLCIRAA